MREKETLSSERKVIGSCCGFFWVVADDDPDNDDCWRGEVMLRVERRGFCLSSITGVGGGGREGEEERRGTTTERVGL